jgi:carbon monoxide dehydrogenase subunit G
MDMTGERRIAAPRQAVWQALNDPAVLKASIPGCESLDKLSDNEMQATAAVKVGPMSGRFSGKVHLADLDPPNGYTISGEGQGGVLGFAKGGARVGLADDGPGTLLQYEVHAQVGGKLAQLGARLIDATAKQMADAFFDRFSNQVGQPAAAAAPAERIYPSTPSEEVARPVLPAPNPPSAISVFALIPDEPFGLPVAFWIGGSIYLLMLLLIIGSLL